MMVKGVFVILLFYSLGQAVSYLIGGFVPGNIIGMMLLFLSLCLKVVTPGSVKDVAHVCTHNMSIFFIPAGVGFLESYGIISKFWMSILVVCSVSTILVVAVVAVIQQRMEKKKG